VTEDVSRNTKAAVLAPGTETDALVRFSTVAERGSPDTWRDPQAFAVRFYTSEGNLDIFGDNTPAFFMRDLITFQSFIPLQKGLAVSNPRDADMQWGLRAFSPEPTYSVNPSP
jgi:catalase